jgi:UDP-N-acetylmuramoylalanine--D-glutamate ligase
MDVKGTKILVVGLGASGMASAILLKKRGADVSVTESLFSDELKKKKDLLLEKGVAVEIGSHTESFCSDHEIVVVSPGVDKGDISRLGYDASKVPVIGEIELGYLFCPAPVVAITGTNGKTTVTSLTGEIFALAGRHTVVCGNIGDTFSGAIEGITERSSVVLEVSSFQLETISTFRPHLAVLLNITDDHYERHGGYENYRSQKLRIFANQRETDLALLHSDFLADPALADLKSRVVFYGGKKSRYRAEDDRVILSSEGVETVIIKEDETVIKGRHNMENIACCCQIAEIEGIDLEVAVKAIKNFKGLDHRFQEIGKFKGVTFIDDSKATNVDATKRALASLKSRVALIAGGRDKLGDYGALTELVREKVSVIAVIGEAREKIKRTFSGSAEIYEAESMEDAVRKCVSCAKAGESIMLSPMCSSFDMFESYSHRGMVFREAVKKAISSNGKERHEK